MDYSVGMDWHAGSSDNFLPEPTPLVKGVVNNHAVLELCMVICKTGGRAVRDRQQTRALWGKVRSRRIRASYNRGELI
jgi:hypothetical protein